MKTEINEVEVNGVVYVKKGLEQTPAQNTNGLDYVIIRTTGAGVHAGFLDNSEGEQVTLLGSRRLWQWSGAKTLSELSQVGPLNVDSCKFAIPVPVIVINGVHEIIFASSVAMKAIQSVKEWK